MKEKTMNLRKAVLRFMIALMLGVFVGAVPGAALVSHADTVVVSEAAVPVEGASEGTDMTFLM